MKTRWLALTAIIILGVCIGPGCVSLSGTVASKATVDAIVKPASGSLAGAINTPQTMPIMLTVAVAAAEPNVISLKPADFSFNGSQGGANPSDQTLTAYNYGAGALNWSMSKTAAWLTLSQESGMSAVSATLSVDISGLKPGIYGDSITITATGVANSSVKVPVVLTISAAMPLNPAIINSIGGTRHCRCGTDHSK
jgi:hypothetical protein